MLSLLLLKFSRFLYKDKSDYTIIKIISPPLANGHRKDSKKVKKRDKLEEKSSWNLCISKDCTIFA